jgi:hypothetical protein
VGGEGVRLLGRAGLLWLVLLAVMMVNGTFRVLVLQPRLGEDAARQAACLTGILLILGTAAPLRPWLGPLGSAGLLAVGFSWLVLTVAFEFLFGHYVAHASWAALAAEYDVSRGRLWPLVLLTVLVAPSIADWLGRVPMD